MPARNTLSNAPPHAVLLAVGRLGEDLRTARLRRNLTIDEVAAKIGAGRRAVSDAERGKATTAMAVYAALLWTYDLLGGLEHLADPARDQEGVILARSQRRLRSRRDQGLDNDF
jgi:transcriptional regulator with XRE-family HTH domain